LISALGGATARVAVSKIVPEGDDKVLVESVVDDVIEVLTQAAAEGA
jgi:hypothetical protein